VWPVLVHLQAGGLVEKAVRTRIGEFEQGVSLLRDAIVAISDDGGRICLRLHIGAREGCEKHHRCTVKSIPS
ncbi:MAG: hypothetical protein H0W24_06170, partial [Lysobacter sp.]|nr:hypothetical protein [Lysobacter sp.]